MRLDLMCNRFHCQRRCGNSHRLVRDPVTKEPAKEETDQLVRKYYEKGLITISAGTHGNVMRTLMPLVISDAELDRGLSILEESLGGIR